MQNIFSYRASIVGKEVLPPPELERIFGLTGGNITKIRFLRLY